MSAFDISKKKIEVNFYHSSTLTLTYRLLHLEFSLRRIAALKCYVNDAYEVNHMRTADMKSNEE